MEKKKILIVEDEPEMRKLLVLELETSGYEVFQAEDGEAGFKVAEELKPDLIISDVLMPKMNGNELLKKLRTSDFGKNVPFVVLTARGKMRDYFEIVHVTAFLEKPFGAEELLATIGDILGGKRGLEKPRGEGSSQFAESADQEVSISDISEETEIFIADDLPDHNEPNLEIDELVGRQKRPLAESPKVDSKNKKRILIIENDSAVYQELHSCFSKHGYIVEVVYSAGRCFEATVLFSPDISSVPLKFFKFC